MSLVFNKGFAALYCNDGDSFYLAEYEFRRKKILIIRARDEAQAWRYYMAEEDFLSERIFSDSDIESGIVDWKYWAYLETAAKEELQQELSYHLENYRTALNKLKNICHFYEYFNLFRY